MVDDTLLAEIKDRATESAESNEAARKCSLILIYTLRKINHCRKRNG